MYDSNKAEGGFVVIDREADSPVGATNKGHIYLAGGPTPKAVKDQFKPGKKQYIGQHKIAWGLAPYSTLVPRVCTRREILHWIDNTSALAGLVKGYAKAADMARVSNAAWALLLGLEAQPYFEYVRSKANIGDLPSKAADGRNNSNPHETGMDQGPDHSPRSRIPANRTVGVASLRMG